MPKPLIMVAPNGARRGRKDHPALPLTIAETAATAAQCAAAGADAIHAHVRDARGLHLLDAGCYRELYAAITAAAPALAVQITSESAGKYNADAQRRLLYDLHPPWASVSLREMLSDGDTQAARRLYHWAAEAGVRLQHILYTPDELLHFTRCIADKTIPPQSTEVLFVLGNYGNSLAGTPAMLADFLAVMQRAAMKLKFMVCAFGKQETACLLAAAAAGGGCRIGFENNLYRADGQLAENNAARVSELITALDAEVSNKHLI